jgi:hypothetical protein
MAKQGPACDWVSLRAALAAFAQTTQAVESGRHIKPLHWYVASRLVVEGGFHPDSLKPRPPFMVKTIGRRSRLYHAPQSAIGGEATVFGGLKTKNVDVVVSLPGLGPCFAVSVKGIGMAFRNLTNRLEEAVGDCTNIHMAYPALVYGFLMFVRANRGGPIPESGKHLLKPDDRTGHVRGADIAVKSSGEPSEMIANYHNAMVRLAGRSDLRDDVSRYEAVGLLMVSPDDDSLGERIDSYPPAESPLLFDEFFPKLYRQYDMRFVLGAPNLKRLTRRHTWDPDSPAFQDPIAAEMNPRIGEIDVAQEEDPAEE